MNKKRAIESFIYYGNRIYSPLGKKNKRFEIMRDCWAKAIDSGI